MTQKLTPREKLKGAIATYGMTVARATTGNATLGDVREELAAVERALTAYTRAIRQEARKKR